MVIPFDKVHDLLLKTLSRTDDIVLSSIGKWYWNFLNSESTKMNMRIPFYIENRLPQYYEYIRLMNLSNYILTCNYVEKFNGLALFDVFNYKPKRKNTFNYFEYKRQFKGCFFFGEDEVILKKDRFCPLFKIEELESASESQRDAIFNSFKLFKFISELELLSKPILIDLNEFQSLSIITSEIESSNYINSKHVYYSNSFEDDDVNLLRKQYYKEIDSQIIFDFPYHRKIDSRVSFSESKRLYLSFYNRFVYQELDTNDIFLLPSECKTNGLNIVIPNIEIFNTDHVSNLYSDLHEYKDSWESYEFNKFTTPFPKCLFLLINRGKNLEYWKNMFYSNYPQLIDKPILEKTYSIIEDLYDLDWWNIFISNNKDASFIVSDLLKSTDKYISEALKSLKSYLGTIDPRIEFFDSINNLSGSSKKIFILNRFNILDIINNDLEYSNYTYLFPDFLYFVVSPWIKYHIISYQTKVLKTDLRREIDGNYNLNMEYSNKLIQETVKEIKTEIKNYTKKYNIEEESHKELDFNEEIELILNNDEEVDKYEEVNNEVRSLIDYDEMYVSTSEGEIFKFNPRSKILLKRNSIISTTANQLIDGDSFIPYSSIRSIIREKQLINKLNRIPDNVRNYQSLLFTNSNVYDTLVKKGLSHKNKDYFEKTYLLTKDSINDTTFHIPRKRDDWKIISDYIGISSEEELQTWMVHYGRTSLNKLTNLYEEIFKMFYDNEWIGNSVSQKFYNKIEDLIENTKIFSNKEFNYSSKEITDYVMNSLVNEILIFTVKTIAK